MNLKSQKNSTLNLKLKNKRVISVFLETSEIELKNLSAKYLTTSTQRHLKVAEEETAHFHCMSSL